MNTYAPALLIAASTVATLAGVGHVNLRNIRRHHAADPRNERWLCENLECTKHLRHRGPCNWDGAR